jgi:hypothetical protein
LWICYSQGLILGTQMQRIKHISPPMSFQICSAERQWASDATADWLRSLAEIEHHLYNFTQTITSDKIRHPIGNSCRPQPHTMEPQHHIWPMTGYFTRVTEESTLAVLVPCSTDPRNARARSRERGAPSKQFVIVVMAPCDWRNSQLTGNRSSSHNATSVRTIAEPMGHISAYLHAHQWELGDGGIALDYDYRFSTGFVCG